MSTSTTGAGQQDRKRLGVRLLTPEGAVFDDVAYMVIATVQILAEQAELADEIDPERAQAALEKAEAALADAGDDEVARAAAEAAIRRARNRLEVADR